MNQDLNQISTVSEYLISKFTSLDFIAAYEWNKHVAVYQNKIEDELNYNALRLFCIKSIGPDKETTHDNNDIIIDYGRQGVLAFYQFNAGCWLIIAAPTSAFPLINLEINKLERQAISFDLSEIKEDEIQDIEIEPELEIEIDPKLLAAKRLQESTLPDLTIFDQYFEKSFCYYSPEDVLSGDFYWLKDEGDALYFVVGDCTGHSIEGALATMTVVTLLNQKTTGRPADIIRHVYQDLIKTGEVDQTGYSVGVELAIGHFDKKNKRLDVATSGVPILYIKDTNDYQVLKVRGTQMPLTIKDVKIETTILEVEKGQKLIMYSDGLIDQFDKNDDKKLGSSGARKLLLSMNGNFAKHDFENLLNNWKGQTRQLDDITVLGIEF